MTGSVALQHRNTLLLLSLQGGGILDFRRDGQQLMFRPPAQPQLACFPMLPFCSRINLGQLRYEADVIQLTPNFLPEPHAIHGFGWQSVWQIGETTDSSCVLRYHHDDTAIQGTGWPWAFVAEQHFALVEHGLLLTVMLENQSDQNMPAGIGLHPHFPLSEPTSQATCTTHVTLNCRSRIRMDESFLPEVIGLTDDHQTDGVINPLANQPWRQRELDDVFFQCVGPAQIRWQHKPWSLVIEADSTMSHWIAYAPRGQGFICIEPISHLPNAVNVSPRLSDADGGMKQLKPGERWKTTTTFWLLPSAECH